MKDEQANTSKENKENSVSTSEEQEYNKVPHWSQRCASGVIDIGILFILYFIFLPLISMTPLGPLAGQYQSEMAYCQKDAALTVTDVDGQSLTYGHVEYLTEENQEIYKNHFHYKDDDGKEYVVVVNEFEDEATFNKLYAFYTDTYKENPTYKTALFNYKLVNYGINVTSLALGDAILILIIPLINKRRATMGQILSGTRCVNSKLETKARWWKIVIRYFWVVIVEIALPVLSVLNVYSIIVVPLILYFISLFNKKRRTLRDYVSATRFIDEKSYKPIGHGE